MSEHCNDNFMAYFEYYSSSENNDLDEIIGDGDEFLIIVGQWQQQAFNYGKTKFRLS
jgi:hypothetical protein